MERGGTEPSERQDADCHPSPGVSYSVSCQALRLAFLPLCMFLYPFAGWSTPPELHARCQDPWLALKLCSVGLDGHIHGLVSPFGIHIMMELRPGAETISVTKAWLGEPPWGPIAESFSEQGSWPGSRVRVGRGWGESLALTGTVLCSLSE